METSVQFAISDRGNCIYQPSRWLFYKKPGGQRTSSR